MATLISRPSLEPFPTVRELESRAAKPPTRLVSLDAYRGFVMLLMASGGLGIAATAAKVSDDSSWRPFWQFLAHQVEHVEWTGCVLWDLIQPSFMFIVGVALPFSLAKRRSQGQTFGWMLFHAAWRSLLLIALGIFLRSTHSSQSNFTFEDVLTQIGLGYTILFLLAWTRPWAQLAAAAVILVGYWIAFAVYPLPGPHFDYLTVGVTAKWHAAHGLTGFAQHWDKNTNFAANFDQWFLNLFPRSKPFIYNTGGYLTLSFIPSLATMIFGLTAGELLRTNQPDRKKFWILAACGLGGLVLGTFFHLTGINPIVKRIWTPSWTIYAAGWTCLLLALFFAVIDWAGYRDWSLPMIVVGMNSIAMYVMADSPFKGFVRDSLHIHFGRGIFDWAGMYQPIVEASVLLFILWLICLWMYRRKVFLRI
jgi:predicted acyltransferase